MSDHGPSTFVNAVRRTVREHGLLRQGEHVLVAVSGGPDSMALLTALVALAEPLRLGLAVAHLDHGLRGDAAREDAAFVASHAASLGLPAHTWAVDVAAERRRGESIEAAARRLRYGFLERTADAIGATAVAVGHTADDQVETILEGLLRGGELGALAGMPVSRPLRLGSPVRVVRPLLEVARTAALGFLAEQGVPCRLDASNADTAFERNVVRHELLPALEARAGAGLRTTLLELAGPARELAAAVDGEATRTVAAAEGAAVLDVEHLRHAPSLVRRAALRRACVALAGPGEVRRRALDAAESLLEGASGREADLGRGIVARRSYDELRLSVRTEGAPEAHEPLSVPGRVELARLGLWVEAERLAERPDSLRKDRWEEVVDLDQAGEHLILRTRRPGDRFVPLGAPGSKKLKEFLIDERVPRAERGSTLVVEGEAGIVWVVGHRLDDRAKVTPHTRRFARLRAGTLTEKPKRG